ncbi:MAG: hypothetical protein J6332_06160 [Abditibacteriota bacterium]|nr:hypothetical protein [Abditibacteriota bacterium]MBP5737864.1 hypothetical protein [Abditibacteriota bacterium]
MLKVLSETEIKNMTPSEIEVLDDEYNDTLDKYARKHHIPLYAIFRAFDLADKEEDTQKIIDVINKDLPLDIEIRDADYEDEYERIFNESPYRFRTHRTKEDIINAVKTGKKLPSPADNLPPGVWYNF